jgi:hypothetical protein
LRDVTAIEKGQFNPKTISIHRWGLFLTTKNIVEQFEQYKTFEQFIFEQRIRTCQIDDDCQDISDDSKRTNESLTDTFEPRS